MDESIRDLERRAGQGDQEAADRLLSELVRSGRVRFWACHPAGGRPTPRSIPVPTTGEWVTPLIGLDDFVALVASGSNVRLFDATTGMRTTVVQDEARAVGIFTGGVPGYTNTFGSGSVNVAPQTQGFLVSSAGANSLGNIVLSGGAGAGGGAGGALSWAPNAHVAGGAAPVTWVTATGTGNGNANFPWAHQ